MKNLTWQHSEQLFVAQVLKSYICNSVAELRNQKSNDMTKNVKLIYDLIRKDLKAQGWEDEAIADAIAESLRERQTTGADDKTICVKEKSYLSQESIQTVAQQLNQKNFIERIRPIGDKICTGFKVLMPYMSLLAVILCLANLIYMTKLQSDIKDLQYSVENINTDYDNSDVINAIEDAEGNIIGSVEDAESKIRRDLIIWSN